MDNNAAKAYVAAVQAAFTQQQVLRMSYINGQGQYSVRNIIPCSPFALNADGTLNFNAYSEVIDTEGRDSGPGVFTFRIDRIVDLKLSDIEVPEGFWDSLLGNGNGGTVIFPGPKTPLFRGKFPKPTVATVALPQFKQRGWTTEPSPGFVQKPAPQARPTPRAYAAGPNGVRLLQ
jgi:hypothetical protein